MPHLKKNLIPLSLKANKENQTAFLSLKSKSDPKLNRVHYIDTKEGKVIKEFTFKGFFNRPFFNLSDTFVPFDNDSKLAFSKKGNLCIFDLKKSSCALTKTCISPLRHCVKAQLDLSNKEGGNNLESLTLSKSRFGSRFLWSLVRDKQKKYIYGFRLNEGNEIEKFALYKFKLPHSLKEATRVSLLKKAKGEYTFVVSTSLKKPESSLYRVRYKKSPKTQRPKTG